MNESEFDSVMDEMMKTPEGRKEIIKQVSIPHPENWQCVETPYDIVKEMIDGINVYDDNADAYIVMFSLEFLEELVMVRKFPVSQIGFMADNELEMQMAKRMYNVTNCEILSKDIVCSGGGFDTEVVKQALVKLTTFGDEIAILD